MGNGFSIFNSNSYQKHLIGIDVLMDITNNYCIQWDLLIIQEHKRLELKDGERVERKSMINYPTEILRKYLLG